MQDFIEVLRVICFFGVFCYTYKLIREKTKLGGFMKIIISIFAGFIALALILNVTKTKEDQKKYDEKIAQEIKIKEIKEDEEYRKEAQKKLDEIKNKDIANKNQNYIMSDIDIIKQIIYRSTGNNNIKCKINHNNPEKEIECGIYYEKNYEIGGVPARLIHEIQANVLAAVYYARDIKSNPSFDFTPLIKIGGEYMPVCSYYYSKNFDQVYPTYIMQ